MRKVGAEKSECVGELGDKSHLAHCFTESQVPLIHSVLTDSPRVPPSGSRLCFLKTPVKEKINPWVLHVENMRK